MSHSLLLVDGDPDTLDALRLYLGRSLGYDVHAADSSHAAFDLALQHDFDLAIMDIHLPDHSGAETWLRLKQLQPDCEVIFLTADTEFDTTMDFLRFSLPRERVLTKPLTDLSSLTRLIIGTLGPPVR